MKKYVFPTDIYIPDFNATDGGKWATVACDQYTSEVEYWQTVENLVGDEPSTLSLMLPEVYLSESEQRIPQINAKMRQYLDGGVLKKYESSLIYLERTQSDGKIRRGIVGAIDLEEYDFSRSSQTLIRATEGTVLERIPPRVAIRKGACLEMPHIMILIDDPDKTVIEPIAQKAAGYSPAYDFELMMGSGHVKGAFVNEGDFDGINEALHALADKNRIGERYGVDAPPLLFAIGDGNHSLATAKTIYEQVKKELGEQAASRHPTRYALCEIVNLHDDAIEFEPIYRVLFGVDTDKFIRDFEAHLDSLCGGADEQTFELVFGDKSHVCKAKKPSAQLAVGTLQSFLDDYLSQHPEIEIDYVHGIESTKKLAVQQNTLGILFDGMSKDMLFKTVICDGALPRKTFSMGHAADKRFYIECRKTV
jgi:uncharacterized protein (DUF1015 family)